MLSRTKTEGDCTAVLNVNRLFDELQRLLNVKNDTALALKLDVGRSTISKIRHRRCPIKALIILKIDEVSALSVREFRELMGDLDGYFDDTRQWLDPRSRKPASWATGG